MTYGQHTKSEKRKTKDNINKDKKTVLGKGPSKTIKGRLTERVRGVFTPGKGDK